MGRATAAGGLACNAAVGRGSGKKRPRVTWVVNGNSRRRAGRISDLWGDSAVRSRGRNAKAVDNGRRYMGRMRPVVKRNNRLWPETVDRKSTRLNSSH